MKHFEIQIKRGIQHTNAKLDERKVRLIRKWLARGVYQKVLARRLGVAQSTISQVARNIRWSHIK